MKTKILALALSVLACLSVPKERKPLNIDPQKRNGILSDLYDDTGRDLKKVPIKPYIPINPIDTRYLGLDLCALGHPFNYAKSSYVAYEDSLDVRKPNKNVFNATWLNNQMKNPVYETIKQSPSMVEATTNTLDLSLKLRTNFDNDITSEIKSASDRIYLSNDLSIDTNDEIKANFSEFILYARYNHTKCTVRMPNTTKSMLRANLSNEYIPDLKDAIKNRWRLILSCSFSLMVGFLPMFISLFLKSFLLGNLQSNQFYFIDNTFTNEGLSLFVFVELINLGTVTLLSVLFSLILSGVIQVIKKICWSEGVSFFYDFKFGIKLNFKSTFSIILFGCLIFDINFLAFLFNLDLFIKIFILFFSVFILFPLLFTGLIYSSIYSVNLKQFFKNSFILSVKSYAFSLGMSVLIIIIFLVNYFLLMNPLLIMIISIIFGLASGFVLLIFYEFYFNVFDKLINSKIHKNQFRRGLY